MNVYKTSLIALIAGILIFGAVTAFAARSTHTPRFFVHSTSGFWENALGARHEFENGFTADVSGFQLTFAKLFGLEMEEVELLYILPPVSQIELDLNVRSGEKGNNDRTIPSDQTPWGIEVVYDDPVVKSTEGGEDILVAVLDTGVHTDHPDLAERIVQCKDFTNSRFVSVKGKCDDKNGHGTHVTGTILADGGKDGFGVFGVAPDADLLAYKVCGDDGSCWADDLAFALRHAADEGAHVINLSLGTNVDIPMVRDAVNYASAHGTLVVAAAGNDGPYFESINYPAAYPSVVSVGAFDVTNEVPDWSSRGVNTTSEAYVVEEKDVEFAAPGVNVESAWNNGGYAILSGTSMAAPHVSGLAAKLWQGTADDTRVYLYDTVRDIWFEGDDDATGFGLPMVTVPVEDATSTESEDFEEVSGMEEQPAE